MTAKSLRIALLHFAAPPVIGGVESVMGHHARLLVNAGHSVKMIGGRGETIDARIPFIRVPLADSQHPEVLSAKQSLDRGEIPEEMPAIIDRLLKELQEALDGTDILFVHNVLTMAKNLMLVAALKQYAAQAGAAKVIAWHHDIAGTAARYKGELHGGWPWNLISEPWQDVAIRHVTVSDARKKELCDLTGLNPKDVQVIPSGIDADRLHKLEDYTHRFSEDFQILQANPLLLFPVRITRRKNIEFALKITAALSKDMPGATLVVTGPPGAHNPANKEYLEFLRSLRRDLNLEPRTDGFSPTEYPKGVAHFLSEFSETYLPDEIVADFYRLADGLLMTSIDEGFGIPIIEAGLSRIPIFCTELAPFREIAGDDALYFSLDDDPNIVAERIKTSLTNDATYRLRRHIRARYSWPAIYQRHITPLLQEAQ